MWKLRRLCAAILILSFFSGMLAGLSTDQMQAEAKGSKYWLAGVGAAGMGDGRVTYENGKILVTGTFGKGAKRSDARDAQKTYINKAYPVAKNCQYITADEYARREPFSEELYREKGVYFACSGIYICVKNGKVIKIMDEA